MTARIAAVLAVALCIVLLTARPVHSQDQKDKPQSPGMSQTDMAEMLKKWQAVSSPGPQHEMLDRFVGKWNVTMRAFWAGPGEPSATSTGTAEVKWILDGRFIQEELEAEMMMPGPDGQMQREPMQGLTLTGYDRFQNMYVGIWADDHGTALTSFRGNMSPDGKTLTLYAEMDEPMLDVRGRLVKMVTRFVSPDKRVFEMYDLHAGDDYKVIEVTYERAD